jgi:GDPmannose 4,6-dehydratase
MAPRTALLSGIGGQDGSYLAEFLLERGYRVVGLVRPDAPEGAGLVEPIADRLALIACDIRDDAGLLRALGDAAPDEVYHLAAASHVASSWDDPVAMADVTAGGTAAMLHAVRRAAPGARLFCAGSSEMFGDGTGEPLGADARCCPTNPYGAAKLHAFHLVRAFRARFGLFACTGILFNHESPRRSADFVTRKITLGVAGIRAGTMRELRLGRLDGQRDWGYAGDYVDAMWRMLQQPMPRDVVIGTGRLHSVEDFVREAFTRAGLDWRMHVVQDERFMRPDERVALPRVADTRDAAEHLDWTASTPFESLVHMMVDADIAEGAR